MKAKSREENSLPPKHTPLVEQTAKEIIFWSILGGTICTIIVLVM